MEDMQADTFVEVEFAGKTWKLARLKNKDWAQIHDILRSRRVAQATADWKAKRIDDAHYRFALRVAYDPTLNFTLYDDFALLQVAEAQPVVLWLALRKHQPDLKLEDVEEVMPSEWGLQMVRSLNNLYAGVEEDEWTASSPDDSANETSDEK